LPETCWADLGDQ